MPGRNIQTVDTPKSSAKSTIYGLLKVSRTNLTLTASGALKVYVSETVLHVILNGPEKKTFKQLRNCPRINNGTKFIYDVVVTFFYVRL